MSYKILKYYEKDGYHHLKRIDENNKIVEMSRKYRDIVEAFIRQTASQEEIEEYRKAMSLLDEQAKYENAIKKYGV